MPFKASVAMLLLVEAGIGPAEAFFRPRPNGGRGASVTHPLQVRGGADDGADVASDGDETGESAETSQDASRTMYNKQASNWVRTEPRCLSDFTGR